MADNFDPDKFLAEPSTSPTGEFDPDAFLSATPTSDIGELESGLLGTAQGALFNFGDEAYGVAKSALRSLLPGSDETISGSYEKYRDEARDYLKQAEETNPKSFTAGNIAGGVATSFIPGLGAAGTVGKMALQGAAQGALSGLGASEGGIQDAITDTATGAAAGGVLGGAIGKAGQVLAPKLSGVAGSIADKVSGVPAPILAMGAGAAGGAALADDESAIEGALGGAVTGGGLYYGAKGAKALAKGLLPEGILDPLSRSYQLGQEGVSVASPEFKEQTIEKGTDLARQAAGMLEDQASNLKATQAKVTQNVYNASDKARIRADKNIQSLEDTFQKQQKAQEALFNAKNTEDMAKAEARVNDLAKASQLRLKKAKTDVGNLYNEIDDAAEKAGVVVDTSEPLQMLAERLRDGTSMTEDQVLADITKLIGNSDVKTFSQFQTLRRRLLEQGSNYADPVKAKIMRDAYGAMNQAYEKTLVQNGMSDLAGKISDANRRWAALSDIEEAIIRPDASMGKELASDKTIQTIRNIGKDKAESMADIERMQNAGSIGLGKDVADQTLAEAQTLSRELQQIKDRRFQGIEAPEDLIRAKNIKEKIQELKTRSISADNEELVNTLGELEAMGETELASAVKQKLAVQEAVKPQLDELSNFGGNLETKTDNISNIIQKIQDDPTLPVEVKKQRLTKLLKKYDEVKGSKLVSNMEDVSKDMSLIQKASYGREGGGPTAGGLTRAVVGSAESAAIRSANFAGKAVKSVTEKARNVSQALIKATPEQIKTKVSELRALGTKEGENLASVLDKAAGESNPRTRSALMFGIQQNPGYRKLLGIDSTDENKK